MILKRQPPNRSSLRACRMARRARFSRRRDAREKSHEPICAACRAFSLRREDVDGIVFWSKNPRPLMARLDAFDGYAYYFQFTLNGYGPEIEPRSARRGGAACHLSRAVRENRPGARALGDTTRFC